MTTATETPGGTPATTTRQFTLKGVFLLVAGIALVATLVGIALRPHRNDVLEAWLLTSAEEVQPGMVLEEVAQTLARPPAAEWLDESGSGFALWRFRVTDVAYADSRASFFVKFEGGEVKSSFLLYPLDSAGGGMVF